MPSPLPVILLVLVLARIPAFARDERADVAGQLPLLRAQPVVVAAVLRRRRAGGRGPERRCASGRRYAFVLHGSLAAERVGISAVRARRLDRCRAHSSARQVLDVMPSPSLVRHSGRPRRVQRPDGRRLLRRRASRVPRSGSDAIQTQGESRDPGIVSLRDPRGLAGSRVQRPQPQSADLPRTLPPIAHLQPQSARAAATTR